MTTDLIVETSNPAALDKILQQFGAVVMQSDSEKQIYMQRDGGYAVRVFSNQGYGKVLKTLDELV